MSGTSADGVDAAVVDVRRRAVELVAFATFPYGRALRRRVLALYDPATARVDEICHLNFVLGEVFAASLIELCRRRGVPLASIDVVGSHGQTIHHVPRPRRFGGWTVRSTLQIGEASVIAERTGLTTVADFRTRDVAAGGQGAPLAARADYLLFAHRRRTRAVQNIGGIANVTFLPARCGPAGVIAFDTGPGNVMIDAAVRALTSGRRAYDADGRLARRGRVHQDLLARLMRHPYLRRRPPKSTGPEEFGSGFAAAVVSEALAGGIGAGDLVATLTAFTAESIADAYRRFLPGPPDEVLLCGGGARNPALVDRLRGCLPAANVLLTDSYGLDADAKEAACFALLAAETIRGRPGNVPAATGAARAVVLGKIVPGS